MRYWDAWITDPGDPGQGWADECLVVKLAAEVADLHKTCGAYSMPACSSC